MSTMEDIVEIVASFDASLVLKAKQKECFRHLLLTDKRQDLIVNLPVGYGKSIIYQVFPQLAMKLRDNIEKPVVIVISPLSIIQTQQVDYLAEHGVSACRLPFRDDEDKDLEEEECFLNLVESGSFGIVFCHPEGLLNTSGGKRLLNCQSFVDRVVGVFIDECHIVETWGAEFRTAFQKLKTLPAIFSQQPFIALSGTLTVTQLKRLPTTLGLHNPVIVQENPDRPNIFLQKICKIKSLDVAEIYENIFKEECEKLKKNQENYPVTLLFMPLFYISQATAYLQYLFGQEDISSSCYAVLFSNQDKKVIETTVCDLQSEKPRIKLVLTSSVSGMGFDPPSVVRVIHAKPPKSLSQYLQEIGRAGRRGQNSTALLHYNKRDISKNVPGMEKDIMDYCKNERCLREMILKPFGFSKSENIEKRKCCSYCLDQVMTDNLK